MTESSPLLVHVSLADRSYEIAIVTAALNSLPELAQTWLSGHGYRVGDAP